MPSLRYHTYNKCICPMGQFTPSFPQFSVKLFLIRKRQTSEATYSQKGEHVGPESAHIANKSELFIDGILTAVALLLPLCVQTFQIRC